MTNTFPIFETNEFIKEQRLALLQEGNKIHKAALFKFIFGKYLGNILQFAIGIKGVDRLIAKPSLGSRFGFSMAYRIFLRKLYQM